jgi:MtrB/PioB family decaheme-associated outer membrane protein
MSTKEQYYVLWSLAVGLTCLPVALWAQEASAGQEEDSAVEGEIEVGVDFISDDAFRFGKYTGHTEDGAEPIIDFKIESRPKWDGKDFTSWRLEGWRLGLDSRRIEFDYMQQGIQRFQVGYREIPNNRIGKGFLPYDGFGSNFYSLPSNWTVAPFSNTTAGFLALEDNLSTISIKRKRQRLDLNYNRILNKAWNFTVDYRHEVKDGERTIGSIFGNTGGNPRAVILPAPVDFTTDIVETHFEYQHNGALLGFGFYASWFNNDERTLGWENAFGFRSGWDDGVAFPDGTGQMALEPDNSYVQLRANGAFSLGSSTHISADVAFGSMEQDDALLPYTINPALTVDVPLPRQSADAEIETTMINFRLTSRPVRGLNLRLNYHYDDRDNQTPRSTYLYVGGDSQDQKDELDGRINVPYSYSEEKTDFIASYRPTSGVRLKVGVIYTDYSRTFSEVLDSDQFTHLAGLKLYGWEGFALSLDYEKSDRDIADYKHDRPFQESTISGGRSIEEWENHPLIRKYFLTDREREEYRFRLDFFPTTNLNFALTGSFNEDDYGDGFFGLNEATVDMWTLDAGFYPRENVSLTAYYTNEKYEALQSSRTFANDIQADDPNRNWFANTEDDVDTYNVALNFENMGKNEALEFGFDYTFSDTETLIDVTAVSVNTLPLPLLTNEMTSYSVYGKYRLNDKSAIRLGVEYNELKATDFAVDGILPDTLSNVLLLGEGSPRYDLTLVSLSYRYRF